MQAKTGIAVNELLKERYREDELKADGRFKYTCADKEMRMQDCMLVLIAEVGELCRAVLENEKLAFDRRGDHVKGEVGEEKIREECVQVAAVALSMVERFAKD